LDSTEIPVTESVRYLEVSAVKYDAIIMGARHHRCSVCAADDG